MPGPKYPNAQTEAEWFRTIIKGLFDSWSTAALHGHWWVRAAMECIASDKAQLITSRDGTVVYMLRCWLSPPQPTTAGQHAKYESGNAVLLHWIMQPDDIVHLHNHPWAFQTRILAGGYVEERIDLQNDTDGRSDRRTYSFRPGESTRAGLGDFHRIASHIAGNGDPLTGQGGTWSLVTTGPRVQPWSFLIDGCERDAETFLRQKRDLEAAGTQTRLDY
jgi:hypothetical protein